MKYNKNVILCKKYTVISLSLQCTHVKNNLHSYITRQNSWHKDLTSKRILDEK